ncbi:MAG: hypothetical protein ACRERD_15700 [Candidatus Binatia bacterium]
MKTLNRHTIDCIARAVVSDQRGYGEPVDRLADLVAGLMRNRLEAVGAGGAPRAQDSGRVAPPGTDRRLLAVLLDRAQKHLACAAFLKESDGRSHPH